MAGGGRGSSPSGAAEDDPAVGAATASRTSKAGRGRDGGVHRSRRRRTRWRSIVRRPDGALVEERDRRASSRRRPRDQARGEAARGRRSRRRGRRRGRRWEPPVGRAASDDQVAGTGRPPPCSTPSVDRAARRGRPPPGSSLDPDVAAERGDGVRMAWPPDVTAASEPSIGAPSAAVRGTSAAAVELAPSGGRSRAARARPGRRGAGRRGARVSDVSTVGRPRQRDPSSSPSASMARRSVPVSSVETWTTSRPPGPTHQAVGLGAWPRGRARRSRRAGRSRGPGVVGHDRVDHPATGERPRRPRRGRGGEGRRPLPSSRTAHRSLPVCRWLLEEHQAPGSGGAASTAAPPPRRRPGPRRGGESRLQRAGEGGEERQRVRRGPRGSSKRPPGRPGAE